jgi:hypothetical protein
MADLRGYESALYSGSSRCAPRVGSYQATEGYIISDLSYNTWYHSTFVADTSAIKEIRNGDCYSTTNYVGISGNAYIGISYPSGGYTTIQIDQFSVRKYTTSEPTISISAEFPTKKSHPSP